jgi:hypothetical protein
LDVLVWGISIAAQVLFKSPLDLITGRGHRLALFLPLPIEGRSTH